MKSLMTTKILNSKVCIMKKFHHIALHITIVHFIVFTMWYVCPSQAGTGTRITVENQFLGSRKVVSLFTKK